MPDGVRRIVALYFPGDLCFSRLPIPTGPRGTLEALCDSAVTDLPSRMLQSLTETHPAIGRALWWLTSIELDIARQWLVLAGRFADQRVAHLDCEILARMSAASTGLTDTVPNHFRQTILADITAISTVHVNRVLQALRVSRFIALKRGDHHRRGSRRARRTGRFRSGLPAPSRNENSAPVRARPADGHLLRRPDVLLRDWAQCNASAIDARVTLTPAVRWATPCGTASMPPPTSCVRSCRRATRYWISPCTRTPTSPCPPASRLLQQRGDEAVAIAPICRR